MTPGTIVVDLRGGRRMTGRQLYDLWSDTFGDMAVRFEEKPELKVWSLLSFSERRAWVSLASKLTLAMSAAQTDSPLHGTLGSDER